MKPITLEEVKAALAEATACHRAWVEAQQMTDQLKAHWKDASKKEEELVAAYEKQKGG